MYIGKGNSALPMRNLIHVLGLVVGLKGLVRVRSKDLLPRPRLTMQSRCECGRHLFAELLFRHGREITHRPNGSGLVLDLHHQHGVVCPVDFAQMCMRAANAVLSASRFAGELADNTLIGSPYAFIIRG